MALLPYGGGATVVTTNKLLFATIEGSPAVFTLTQAWIDDLLDLGSGLAACRIVENLQIAGDVSINEAEADLTAGGGAFTLAVTVGAFVLTGLATGLKAARQLAAVVATFALVGTATGLDVTMPTTVGAFTLTGNDATLTFTPAAGAFTLAVDVGAFTLTGSATGLDVAVPASVGAFTLTGSATGLTATRQLPVTVGAFTLTGNATGLVATRQLPVTVGAFTLTGTATGLDVTMPTTVGAFTLVGIDVTLTFTPAAGAFTLVVDVGAFSLVGSATGLTATRQLPVTVGAFALTGTTTGLDVAVPAVLGTFTLTGSATGLTATRQLPVTVGVFTLVGIDATLTFAAPGAFTLVVDAGAFTLTGNVSGLDVATPVTVGAFTLTGSATGLTATRQLPATVGAFTLTGIDTGLVAARQQIADEGTFVLIVNDRRLPILAETIGSWRFAEDLTDDSSSSNDLTGTGIVAGDFGVGYTFPGKTAIDGDRVTKFGTRTAASATDFNMAAGDDFTVEVVAKFDNPGDQVGAYLILAKAASGPGWNLVLDNKPTGTGGIRLQLGDVAFNDFNVTTTTKINDGDWHYVACVVDRAASEVNIYIDNVLDSNFPKSLAGITGSLSNSEDLRAIRGDAVFDEVCFTKRVITVSEIADRFNGIGLTKLVLGRKLTADTGSFTLTGIAAALTFAGGAAFPAVLANITLTSPSLKAITLTQTEIADVVLLPTRAAELTLKGGN